ncbi:hypothetical protein ABE29_16335 [Cytobacillus firmus]|uniref:Uncharacterized protein n=1 Tax=Cytobacillus firmus TaxID=1399 RepID=A0A380XJY8_CYTFI|nr:MULTISPECIES: hypothetical protein [Bacillaceae]KAF0824771.1 hypothetical protein KIS1582_1348 [Cytobacillus firmus]MBG9544298.1 hypothetical protein [Cytobacillus firmus]MBG9554737.1 hypothetical protein [Cytobacillus firmus]MBG9559024.1 hypothetical protein [Cytobacillus firmus]MBG9574442.1 hypothetical protein [Cytobacillus firmus]
MISIEKTSRILNRFNIAFTENAVLRYLQRGQLDKAPRIESGYYSRNTKYGYSVDEDSLVTFLLERGVIEKEIHSVLSA